MWITDGGRGGYPHPTAAGVFSDEVFVDANVKKCFWGSSVLWREGGSQAKVAQ